MTIILEACVDTIDQALRAQQAGAHRIELCSRLDLDGLSPPPEMIRAVLERLDIPAKIMIRPRAGDFIYSEAELLQMELEILFCKELGISEVVLGASLPGGALDISSITRLASVAAPMRITIHKAIDLSPDPLADMEALRSIANVQYILSSGKQPTALEGAPLLRDMIRAARERFTIIAAGKATQNNVEEIIRKTGAVEIHGRKIVND